MMCALSFEELVGIHLYIYSLSMSLTSMTRLCGLPCYRTPVEVEWLPITCKIYEYIYIYYYYYYHMDLRWIIIGDRARNTKNGCYEIVDVVGATGPGLVATESGSRCTFSHLSQLRTIHYCGWQLSFECPSHTGRLAYLTCHGFWLFLGQLVWSQEPVEFQGHQSAA
jgi:hypothetical protein